MVMRGSPVRIQRNGALEVRDGFVSATGGSKQEPDLILDLTAQETARGLDRRLRAYARPSLLCIDEIGYLSYDAHAADLLFQVVSRRYEQKSIVLTTN